MTHSLSLTFGCDRSRAMALTRLENTSQNPLQAVDDKQACENYEIFSGSATTSNAVWAFSLTNASASLLIPLSIVGNTKL